LNNKIKVSILIANYNNKDFINKCIKSLLNQTYKNLEIIFHDDYSKDGSIKIASKYKKIKIIKNKIRDQNGSFNQLKACERAFKKSSGEIIFLLDSDDHFKKNKVSQVVKNFTKNKKLQGIYDLPIFDYGKKKIKINKKDKLISTYWPYIPPQSCISIRRKYFKKIINSINFKKFPNIWMDFRIAIYLKYISKNYFILDNNLTYYRQSSNNVSSNFSFLSPSWWKRRMEAHEYIKFFFIKNKINYKKNYDYYLTLIMNKFI